MLIYSVQSSRRFPAFNRIRITVGDVQSIALKRTGEQVALFVFNPQGTPIENIGSVNTNIGTAYFSVRDFIFGMSVMPDVSTFIIELAKAVPSANVELVD